MLTGVILIGLSLIFFFARDKLWEMQEYSARLRGLVSERTTEWEEGTISMGVVLLVLGIFILIFSMY